MVQVPPSILSAFSLNLSAKAQRYGSGHIHKTFLVEDDKKFILQQINTNIFKKPETIAANNKAAAAYLSKHHPGYPFMQAIATKDGSELVFDEQGLRWRLLPFFDNTISIDQVAHQQEGYEAATGFGRLTKNLEGVDIKKFEPTLPDFHNLVLRYEQYKDAKKKASETAIAQAHNAIWACESFYYLVEYYEEIISGNKLKTRVVHNDTKINNILFNSATGKAACVIDLDTLMPGYFIYDLGDMVRTMTSPASEEESDLSKISFRKNFYDKLLEGYLSEMDGSLTAVEREAIPFAGKMMTYIMALRFLADYLRGNTYYHISYPEQNLVRARNQLHLLSLIVEEI